MNFGLSDREEELDVKISLEGTIGTSIRGYESGEPERIRIRDAAAEIGPRIEDAAKEGFGVVMKIDCEGSEFAIFDSLIRSRLLPKIDAFAIEWHKWWSREKTQADLLAPLIKAGFFVIDRSRPEDEFGGLLLAVRSPRSL